MAKKRITSTMILLIFGAGAAMAALNGCRNCNSHRRHLRAKHGPVLTGRKMHCGNCCSAPQAISRPRRTHIRAGLGGPQAAPPGEILPAGAPPSNGPPPTELQMVSHAPYRVAPPDLLLLDLERVVPRPPYFVQPMDVLTIVSTDTLPKQPVAGKYVVSAEGTINLGFSYGTVRVGGLTIGHAQDAVRKQLAKVLQNPKVSVALESIHALPIVRGEHLVRPDGAITLGAYGSVYVAGMTLDQIKWVIERHLSNFLLDPRISVDVFAYNSKKYFVIADGAGYGQMVLSFPYTGNETVLDAVSKINGLPAVSSKKYVWVARPGPAHLGCSQILPVDWRAITENGQTKTNWQLMPGDRVYVRSDPLIHTDNILSKLLRPVERVLGITLLGTTTYNSIRNSGNRNVIVGAGF